MSAQQLPMAEGWTALTFGEPESVLDRSQLFDMFQVYVGAHWYEPPISQIGLGKAYRMAPHHQSCIALKRNLLAASFRPNRWLSRKEFGEYALDYLTFGNGYLERIDSITGKPISLKRSPAAWTRVGHEAPGQFWFMQPGLLNVAYHEFLPGTVHHLIEPDPLQEIYGMPEYLSAVQSGLLNENATLFRRRYYLNGSHAGFILYISEANYSEADVEAMREALRNSKGPGNFRNLLLHIPNGKKDGVQILPIAEVAAKDEFLGIKEVTRDDMLAAHRVPPQLLGIVPKNGTGFGSVIDAARSFYALEICPLQIRMQELNDWFGADVLTFEEPANIAALVPAAVAAAKA